MPKLIGKQGKLVDPHWIDLTETQTDVPSAVVALQPLDWVKCPLLVWQDHRAVLEAKDIKIALQLAGDDEPDTFAEHCHAFAQIHIHFPDFKDGRGYSLARLMRDQYGFVGQLRAVGDITQDQLFYLARCGFDAFELRDDQDVAGSLAAFSTFSQTYQAAADQPLPIYRR